jgi:hypothetical protein
LFFWFFSSSSFSSKSHTFLLFFFEGDGLHFGKAAKDASKRATETFVTTLKKLLPALHKFKHFQVALEKSFLEAHKVLSFLLYLLARSFFCL